MMIMAIHVVSIILGVAVDNVEDDDGESPLVIVFSFSVVILSGMYDEI